MSPAERAAHEQAALRLTAPSASLPDFSKALEIVATARPEQPGRHGD